MYRVSEGIRSTRNQDGGVVLDIQNGKILRLNITGSLIFERLQQGQSELQIIRAISRDFGIPEDTTKRDVGEFLQSLAQQRLLIGESMEKHS
jgi:hypothetical protein